MNEIINGSWKADNIQPRPHWLRVQDDGPRFVIAETVVR